MTLPGRNPAAADPAAEPAALLPPALAHVLAVAEHGSIGRAALALHLTQPALSKSLRRLETRLRVRLFERGALGVAPTPAGAVLVRHARGLRAGLRDALRELDELRGAALAHVHVAMGPAAPLPLLQLAVARFGELLRSHEVTLADVPEGAVPERLAAGEFDVAVYVGRAGRPPVGVRVETLREDRGLVVVAGPAREGPAAALAGVERWVLPPGGRLRALVGRVCAQHGLGEPRVARTTSIPLAIAMLAKPGTASVLPASWAGDLAARGAATVLPEVPVDWTLPVHAAWRPGTASLPVRRFVDALREASAGTETRTEPAPGAGGERLRKAGRGTASR